MKRTFLWLMIGGAILVIAAVATPSLWSADIDAVPTDKMPAAVSTKIDSPWIAIARGQVDIEGGLMRLAAQREGIIAEVFVNEGDRVTPGQTLARIKDTRARLQLDISKVEVEQAATQLKLAKTRARHANEEAKRLRPLAKADAIDQRQSDEARRRAELARLEVKTAAQTLMLAEKRLKLQQEQIESYRIQAPAGGIILRRSARPGDGATTNTVTEMFLLAPDGERIVRADIDEQFVGRVHPGQTAEIISERNEKNILHGKVMRVAPVFGTPGKDNKNAQTLEIIVKLESPEAAIEKLVLGQRMLVRIFK